MTKRNQRPADLVDPLRAPDPSTAAGQVGGVTDRQSQAVVSSGSTKDAAASTETSEETICFGPFILKSAQRTLLLGDQPVQLGSRALDILCLLVERAGLVVGKDDILARVWPGTFAAEGNLRVHVASLRRALGDGSDGQRYIVNVPNRGYSFIEAVSRRPSEEPARAIKPAAAPASRSLPILQHRVIGRDEASRALKQQIHQHRLVTVVGAGGVGKTTLAVSTVSQLIDAPGPMTWGGTHFVDLASLAEPQLVPGALASALGLAAAVDDALPSLLAFLRGKEILILFDNCEHVIGAVAHIAEAILRGAPQIHIVATSREPLRIDGEYLHHLQPLAILPADSRPSADEAITCPAIELFVERSHACSESFALRDEDVGAVIEICRRLDGIPLALELAAGRVDAFGVRGLAAALDSLFAVLTKGRRTALPRHRTLHATLDWSFNLLAARDRILLKRLSVFSGAFTLRAASAVAAWGSLSASDVVEGISDLVAHSLVTADVSHDDTLFRLLETTRAYGRERLAADAEADAIARRLAEHCRAVLSEAEVDWPSATASEWLRKYAWFIDDVRASLTWAFSARGDANFGVALTVAAVPLWFQLSLINECRERVEQALAAFDPEAGLGNAIAMKLHAARGWSLMYTAGPARESGAAWAAAHEIAESIDDTDYRLRSLWGLWAGKMSNGEFLAARELADRFCRLAPHSADPSDRDIGDRLMGASLHFLGDQPGARHHIERMLSRYIAPPNRSHVVRFQFDQRVTARITLARVLWLQGFADQAMRTVDSNLDDALSLKHTLTLCNTLAQAACPVALLVGDLDRAERYTNLLQQETERHAIDIWQVYANCYRGQHLIRRGDLAAGLPLVRAAVDQLRGARFVQYYTAFLTALADGLVDAGRAEEALVVIDEGLTQSVPRHERWCTAEMLRIKGEIALRLHGADGAASAEGHFVQSLKLARQQQALAWELRTATSLARLKRDQSDTAAARALLTPVLDRFTEGFDTTDLKAANLLLEELA